MTEFNDQQPHDSWHGITSHANMALFTKAAIAASITSEAHGQPWRYGLAERTLENHQILADEVAYTLFVQPPGDLPAHDLFCDELRQLHTVAAADS